MAWRHMESSSPMLAGALWASFGDSAMGRATWAAAEGRGRLHGDCKRCMPKLSYKQVHVNGLVCVLWQLVRWWDPDLQVFQPQATLHKAQRSESHASKHKSKQKTLGLLPRSNWAGAFQRVHHGICPKKAGFLPRQSCGTWAHKHSSMPPPES